MPKNLQQKIKDELGISTLPEAKQTEILEKIGQLIFQGIMIQVVEGLSEDDQDDFSDILDEIQENPKGGEKMMTFLQERVPKLDEIVKDEVDRFRKDSLDLIKK